MRKRIRIADEAKGAEDKILLALHEAFAKHGARDYSRVGLVELTGIRELGVLDSAVRQLSAKNLITSGPSYSIIKAGLDAVESWTDEYWDSVAGNAPAADEIPASDRMVSLNHNQPEYTEAVTALDKVITEFAEDHRIDNQLGKEKGALLKALQAGRELLDDSMINVRVGTALILEPLARIVQKYEQTVVATFAQVAWDLFKILLGIK